MKHLGNIRQVAALSPDWMGFIFYSKSSRYFGLPEPRVMAGVPEQIKRVGVFVNEKYERILDIVERYGISMIQLHGDETPELCRKLRERGFQVMKALGIQETQDFEQAIPYGAECDFLLFDTKSDCHGGTGRTFDWGLLDSYRGTCPFLLSGGIGPEVLQALKDVKHPYLAGIDLNSRFEIAPGYKDVALLSCFLRSLNFEL